ERAAALFHWLSAGAVESLSLARRQAIEPLLLLVAQRAIELLQRRLDRLHCAQHRIEPLLHGLEPHHRRERAVGRAIRLEQLDRLRGGVLQLPEGAALRLIRAYGPLDLGDRQAGNASCALATHLRQITLVLLVRDLVRPERVETRLLLVVE